MNAEKSFRNLIKSDCIYHFPIDLEPKNLIIGNQKSWLKIWKIIDGSISRRNSAACGRLPSAQSCGQFGQLKPCQIKPSLDCNYTFLIYLDPNWIQFGAKSIGKGSIRRHPSAGVVFELKNKCTQRNQIWIVITIFRLICHQMKFSLDPNESLKCN